MSQLQQQNSHPTTFDKKWNEQILVVKRNKLFPHGTWKGLKAVDFDWYLKTIQEQKEFTARGPVETNFDYKQIIPYLIFTHDNKYFLMQRQAKASENRLASKYTLGIGGHLREEDLKGDNFFEWAQREFHEEVNYTGNLEVEPLGVLNDDSNDVGKVHVGFVLLLKGDNPNISIKSELAGGTLLSSDECKAKYAAMETWSQLAFDFIQTHK
jgi:predicted NUDIX family phosphoesterase